MSKLTLDLNGLNVESFAPEGMMGESAMTAAFTCGQNAVTPMTLTNRVCCEGAGVEACTVKEPCCGVVTP